MKTWSSKLCDSVMAITLPNNWVPRPYQMPLWSYLEGGGKRAVGIWHRRSGKDDVALHWTAVAAHERPGNYWHLLPLMSQARPGDLGSGQPGDRQAPHRRGVPAGDSRGRPG